MIYLDNNATTKICEEVIEMIYINMKENFGNPSSFYTVGQKSKKSIENARENISKHLLINPKELIFTSGGSEANNLAIKGILDKEENKNKHFITSSIEHSSVLKLFKYYQEKGYEITFLNVNKTGKINIEDLKDNIKKNTKLISIMYSNNETGVKQDIELIGEIAKENKILFHVDAVQAIGKENIDIKNANIDLMSFSGHKFYAPKGIGALYVKDGIELEKQMFGGYQERNRRAGTENILGIIGMSTAFDLIYENLYSDIVRIENLRNYMEFEIKKNVKSVYINGEGSERICNTSNVKINGTNSDSMLLMLDMKGICVSAGSACASGGLEGSHVLKEMGLSFDEVHSSLRISLGKYTTKEEIDYFLSQFYDIIARERF